MNEEFALRGSVLAQAVLTALLASPPPVAPNTSTSAGAAPVDLEWMISPRVDAVPPRPKTTPTRARHAAEIYRGRCAACHGDAGRGDGPMATRLRVRPTDFAKGVYKLRSTPTGELPRDEDLFRTLTRGHHGTPMLPWRDLPAGDRWGLVDHLKSLSVRFASESPPAAVPVPPPPRESDQLRDRGASMYALLRCGGCHGPEGEGNGQAAEAYGRLRASRDVHIRNFARGRFIRGAELEDIYLTLRTGLDGTPMGAYDVLKTDELWALAAYVRSLVRERPLTDLPPAGDRVDTRALPARR